MAVTGDRTVSVQFTGDECANLTYSAATNTSSPGAVEPVALSTGNNTISVPAGTTAITITKPEGNTVAILFKNVAGDSGFKLGLTDVDSFSVDPSQTSFVLNAASAVTVRIAWS